MIYDDFKKIPKAKYGLISLDPPWGFSTYSKKDGAVPQRKATQHYETMTLKELAAMDVGSLAQKDCVMCMWILDSMFVHALYLGKKYGFEYKGVVFVWNKLTKTGKPAMGMGYWSRKGAELCLLFTRGKPKRFDRGVRQVISAPIREHSRKPDEARVSMERLFGDVTRIEMFSRCEADGWDQYGNETGMFK